MSSPPKKIGHYLILEQIGHGGMGMVYRARDPRTMRDVAIKLFREGLDDSDTKERFGREARSAARLSHVNIVHIFELGEHNGRPFLAMEYVQGETLASFFKQRSPVSLSRKLEIMDQVCAGLDYAHRMGVVHRDIKPSNIMIDTEGTVKILDFGIAGAGGSASTMTQAGAVMRTLDFMAPEQIEGKPPDARADMFSTGTVFYELLSYQRAFAGEAPETVIQKILHGQPERLEAVSPNLDPELVAIVDRCLEKQPEHRYPDLGAVRRALSAVRRRMQQAENETEGETTMMARPTRLGVPGAEDTPPSGAALDSDTIALERRIGLERRREGQLLRHLATARQALERGDFGVAFAECEQALMLDPTNQQVLELEARARAVVDRRRKEDERRRFEEEARRMKEERLAAQAEADRREREAARREAERRWKREEEEARQRLQAGASRLKREREVEPPDFREASPSDMPATQTTVSAPAGLPERARPAIRLPRRAGGVLARLVRRIKETFTTVVLPTEPTAPPPQVLLGVSAPREVAAGTTFVARFVAYVAEVEPEVARRLRDLDSQAPERGIQTALGLAPTRGGRWVVGAPVTVRVSGPYLVFEPAAQLFEWNGRANVVSFVARVAVDAPRTTIPLCFEAFIEGVPVAFIPLNLRLGLQTDQSAPQVATVAPAATAFASYASQDAPLVALCLSALKRWDPQMDVFMDCLDLQPTEPWQRELERVIPSRDSFLLFWSVNAMNSKWVAWELATVKAKKGIDAIRPMPIDDPAIAPPPDDLKHLHFRDRYLIARQGFLRIGEERR